MLCPEGYVTIPDILDTVPDPNFEGEEPNFQLRSEKKERLVFQAILKNDALRVCLPDGTILKIHHEILDMVSLSDVFICAKIPDSSFGSLDQSNDFWASCRNPEIGMPLFFTRPYYLLSLENYKALKVAVDKAFPKDYNQDDIWAATCLPFESDPMWPVVSKFEGASLCAVSDKIPKKISLRNFQKSKGGRPSNKGGRPSNKPEIVEFYQKHYPNRNGSDSWKEVNAKLLEITGIDVHEDTIKRALDLKQ